MTSTVLETTPTIRKETKDMEDNEPQRLRLSDITGVIQLRVVRSSEAIEDYAVALKNRKAGGLPPVVAFRDPETGDVFVADGDHRIEAAKVNGQDSIKADIRPGTRRDAILYAAKANGSHGLRRTRADKRNAVQTLLADEEWSERSDHWIAQQCAVSQPFVSEVREQLQTLSVDVEPPAETIGRDGRKRKRRRKPNLPHPDSFTNADDKVESPRQALSVVSADEAEPPLCGMCKIRDSVDGQRCQVCIDENRTVGIDDVPVADVPRDETAPTEETIAVSRTAATNTIRILDDIKRLMGDRFTKPTSDFGHLYLMLDRRIRKMFE
jgi:hypothetical protein